jgi:endoglucanase
LLLLDTLPAQGAAYPISITRDTSSREGSFVTVDPFDHVKQMGRGVNILGYDPIWKDFSRGRFKERHFQRIHDCGFQTVRVALQAFGHMDSQGKLQPAWLQTLDWVVNAALANGLNVILDEHDYNPCATDAAACREKLLAFWSQVGPRYQESPSRVIFEILNEAEPGADAPSLERPPQGSPGPDSQDKSHPQHP